MTTKTFEAPHQNFWFQDAIDLFAEPLVEARHFGGSRSIGGSACRLQRSQVVEKLECREGTPDLLASYLKFAADQFGKSACASNERYLAWLYEQNPFGGRWTDALLAVTSAGDVVGCMHAMNIPWRIDNELVVVPALHNLMVSPEHRQGVGMRMAIKAVQGRSLSIIPATLEPTASLYRRLGCVRVESSWYRRVLRPLHVGWQLGAQKLWGWNPSACHFPEAAPPTRLPSAHDVAFWATAPTDSQLEQLAEVFNAARTTADGPDFSPEFLRWRFFHEFGPRHAVVWLEANGRISEAVVLSLGPRRSFNVGRIVAAQASDADRFAALVKLAEHLIRRHGGTLLFTFCACPELNRIYSAMGWRPQANEPHTYLSSRRNSPLGAVSFNGEAGDIGFEALPSAA